MERQRRVAFLAQLQRHPLGFGSAAAIDDAALAPVRLQEVQKLRRFTHLRRGRQTQIGPVEAGDEHRRVIHPQRRQDVGAGAWIGRRGQCDSRHTGEDVRQSAQLAKFWPELVAPLRDAVRLVNGDQRQPQPGQPLDRAVAEQPLGRDVEQVESLLDQVARNGPGFGRIKLRMQRAGVDADLAQRRDLVIHQRNQWGDDHRGSGPTQGRHLITYTLAAAGRHQDERIATKHDVVHSRRLLAAKTREAENLAQHLRGIAEQGVGKHPETFLPIRGAPGESARARRSAKSANDLGGRRQANLPPPAPTIFRRCAGVCQNPTKR